MDHPDLAAYARTSAAPIRDSLDRTTYRCAAYLKDGLYLPCVVLASAEVQVDLAIRRFEETIEENRPRGLLGRTKSRGLTYRDIVGTFVIKGNRLNHYDIDRLEPSPFAIPLERLAEVHGETSMAWTQFSAVMRDGSKFSFGTTFLMEFFQMPSGYSGQEVVQVISHERTEGELYRERPFFTCFVEGLKA
jgi:hypothetical protein